MSMRFSNNLYTVCNILLFVSAFAVDGNATSLKFLLMVASGSSQDSLAVVPAVVPAVDKTLDKLNRDTSILHGHRLEYILRDTQVI